MENIIGLVFKSITFAELQKASGKTSPSQVMALDPNHKMSAGAKLITLSD